MPGGPIASLSAALRWDLSDFDRGTRHIEGAFGYLREKANALAESFTNAGKRMTAGMTLPLTALAGFSLKAASDAQELQSAYNQTFGEMAKVMNDWAVSAGDAMGRSTEEMQKGAMAFGQLFNSAAPTRAMAAGLSQDFTKLAQDAASFFNTDFDTAMGKIRSGLTGESEPLRDFAVFLNEAAVEAKALEMGLIKTGQKLDEYGKIMARAVLITEGLADASGDVIRTQDSFANRTRALTARISELSVELGERLLPFAEKVIGIFDRMLEAVQALPKWVKDLAFNFGLFLAAIGPVSVVLSALALTVLPLFLARLGPLFLAISAILNPLGTGLILLGKWAGAWGLLGRVMAPVLAILLRMAGPIGAIVTLLLILERLFPNTARAADEFTNALKQGNEARAKAADLTTQLTIASGKAREALLAEARAELTLARARMETDRGALRSALTNARQAQAAVARFSAAGAERELGVSGGELATMRNAAQFRARQAWENVRVAQETAWGSLNTVKDLIGAINAPDPTGTRDYALPDDPTKPKRARVATGPTAEELAIRREMLRLEQEIAVARARGDAETERAIQREIDLRNRVEAYQDAGLNAAQAAAAAQRDMNELAEAEAETRARMIEQDERRFDMRLAEIRGDYSYLRTLEDQEFLAERIAHWKERGKAATEAEKLAADDLAAIEAARADNLRRRVEDQERSRQLELARIRGDDPSDVRRLEQELRVRQRAAELEASFDMNESEAKAQAEREAAEENRAFMQGYYRDVVKGGFTAALQGDFKGWFERWWHDRIFNSMESLLNQLGDLLAGIGSKSSGGGGLLGTIGSVAGAIIGGKSSGKPIKKFASGGGFEIRGFPGIDQNLLSLNGNPVAAVSQGEIVNVQQGAAGREPAIVQLVIGEGQMFEPRVASISGGVTVQYGRQRDRYAGLRAGQRLA